MEKEILLILFLRENGDTKMRIRVEYQDEKKELEIEEGEKVQDVLDKLNIKYDFVVTFLDEKPVPIDEPLKENCKLKVLVVVSGG